MKSIDRLFRYCFIFALLVFVGRFCQNKTDHFTILKITSHRAANPDFAVAPLSPESQQELNTALSQPYSYSGYGGQAFIFFSEDGNYVIKFFKERLYKRSFLLNALPLPKILHRYREKKNWKRADKLKRDFFSYKISMEELKEETAVIYSHLNPTDHLNTKLKITDPVHIEHILDLDQMDFIVQKRGVLPHDHINNLMRSNRIKEAKVAIGQMFHLISSRALKGYRDRDPDIATNCGYFDNRAIKLDVGCFIPCLEMCTVTGHNEELSRITEHFREWIQASHPTLLDSYDKQLDEVFLK